MYKTIVLDCQAKVVSFNCEDCIAFRECTFGKKKNESRAEAEKTDNMEIFVSHI